MVRLFNIILFCLLCFVYQLAFARPSSSVELIDNARQYDGKDIVYSGEVIGDVMRRGEFAWVNINDGTNAIGIWAGKDLIKDIVYSGSYKSRGDIIEIKGVFHRSCIEHGGDLDIHAVTIKKIKEGCDIVEKINPLKIKLTVILLGVLCLALILMRLKRK